MLADAWKIVSTESVQTAGKNLVEGDRVFESLNGSLNGALNSTVEELKVGFIVSIGSYFMFLWRKGRIQCRIPPAETTYERIFKPLPRAHEGILATNVERTFNETFARL